MIRTTFVLSAILLLAIPTHAQQLQPRQVDPEEVGSSKRGLILTLTGLAMAGAGAAVLLIDPTQPTQPDQIPLSTLEDEMMAALTSGNWTSDLTTAIVEAAPECLINPATQYLCGTAGTAGAATALDLLTAGDRTVYARPIRPYQERSPTMKYGGAALVIGGAVLSAIGGRSGVRASLANGGLRLAKTVSW